MKRHFSFRLPPVFAVVAGIFLAVSSALAYPPAPSLVIYGMVRDEFGDPLNITSAEVSLITLDGRQIATTVSPGIEAGSNYRLIIPMDSGITSDAYKPNALRPTLPFTMRVRIGNTVYLPIQMTGNYSSLGTPGSLTRIDLTLGEDSDGDGLPDAWERALIALAGGSLTLADIRPGDDFDHDGLNNLQEYIAGTYAFDPKDGFALAIISIGNGVATMEFLAITSRSYSIQLSTDLKTWTTAPFHLSTDASDAAFRSAYLATDIRKLRVNVPFAASGPVFFKALVQ